MNISRQTVDALLQAIAAKQPAPGGGAVAALTLALGAALGEMVLNYSLGKKSLETHAQLHHEALANLQRMRTRALALADEDARAYEALNTVLRQKDNPPSTHERDAAVRNAIDVPAEVLRLAAQSAAVLEKILGTTNNFLDSDLAMSAILLDAAAQSACWNIRINMPELSSEAMRTEFESQMISGATSAGEIARRVQDRLSK